MTTNTVKRRSGYSAVPNAAMSDQRLSIEARGLLALLMTFREGWRFRSSHLSDACGVGRDKFSRMLGELKSIGYLEIQIKHGPNGQFSSNDWVVSDVSEGASGSLKHRDPENAEPGEHPPIRDSNTLSDNNSKTTPDGDVGLFKEIEDAETQESKPDPFDTFWAAYPASVRKTDKVAARKVFRSITLGKHKDHPKVLAADLIDGATRYRRSEPDPKFVPLPATWLNKGRWANTASVSDTSATSSTGGHRSRPPQGEVIR